MTRCVRPLPQPPRASGGGFLLPLPLREGVGGSGRLNAAIPALASGLLALGVMFHREIAAAVRVWTQSTAYNHCFLVAPIAAYLMWDRRTTLAGAVPRPWPAVGLAAIPFIAAWVLAERLGIMEGRQLAAMSLAELLFLAVLGWRCWWLLAGPLLYLYFLVPFGAFVTPALQSFTAGFVRHGLDLLGIANYTDGYTIQIAEGTFYVAEACAGLRFLIASAAFGCLYALLLYHSPLRRAILVAASLMVPILANGCRALGIVVLGHFLGNAEAAETDHMLYGWLFFSLVILLLAAAGLPFREDRTGQDQKAAAPGPAPPLPPPFEAHSRSTICAAAVVTSIAATGLAAAAVLR